MKKLIGFLSLAAEAAWADLVGHSDGNGGGNYFCAADKTVSESGVAVIGRYAVY